MVVAHPDDEIIGAGNYLACLPEDERKQATIVYATGGVPRDRRFAHEVGFATREEYAEARRRERDAALQLAGLSPDQCLDLGYTDQEVCFEIWELVARLSGVVRQADVVLTHAYEGGHPDHDACALACRHVVGDDPKLMEFAGYHRGPNGLVVHEFLAGCDLPVSILELNAEQRARKQRMYDCHRSQQRVLQAFSTAHEKFRAAPAYDFRKPPHAGTLHYETLGWPITGDVWREAVARA